MVRKFVKKEILLTMEEDLKNHTFRLGFFAITEPNAGSDVVSMRTTATDKGDHWEINGSKMWISQAAYADYGLLLRIRGGLYARTITRN